MAWHPGILSAMLFAATGTLLLLAVLGWRRRRNEATTFVVLIVAVSCWAALYGVQLGFSTRIEQLPWQRATLAVSATVPPALLAFAYRYSGRRDVRSGWLTPVSAVEAVAFAALVLTNPSHHLVWTRASLARQGPSPVLDLSFGVGYVLHILFAYLVVTLALWTIVSVYFRSTSIHRKQSALLLAGAIPAFVCHILFSLKASPIVGLDLTPFAFVVTGLTFGSALFHFDLLERTPIARRRAIELTGDGLLVVDTDGTVVDCNRIAEEVYDVDPAERTRFSERIEACDPRALHGERATGVVDGARRTYDVYVSELTTESGSHAGFSVVLRDVTDREAYEQRLRVAYRVLRHNLRNDMNVVVGRAELLADAASTPEQRELAESIRETGTDLLALGEKARQAVDLQRADGGDREVVDVAAVLESVLAGFREEYPTVPVAVDCPGVATASVVSRRALRVALRNVLENVPEHNDASTVSVDVVVTTDERRTRIEVSDTGSGMPPDELAVIRNREETPLQHSSGLGLWLTYWTVSTSGGELSVTESESGGTSVSLTLRG